MGTHPTLILVHDLSISLCKSAVIIIVVHACHLISDIQEFYQYTLDDDSKSAESKTEETLKLAERWQSHPPPVPSEVAELAQKSLDGVVCLIL